MHWPQIDTFSRITGLRVISPADLLSVFGEGDGSHLAVHDTELGRIGALCCWEHVQPLTKYPRSR